MIRLKKGVRIGGVRPEITVAMQIAAGVYSRFNVDAIVTSCMEGKHSTHSRHYVGLAIDLRIRNVPRGQHSDLRNALADALGPDFLVLLEGNHIHVGFKARQGG